MGTILSIRSPNTMAINNGIPRPQQIKSTSHTIASVHQFHPPADKDGKAAPMEQIDSWRIEIKCCDSRLTDLLTRLVSGVLFSNNVSIQNAEENVLREMGKWNEPVADQKPEDITNDPTPAPAAPKGQGDGN